MTNEEKQLLFKVLCAMLPYGIIIYRLNDNSVHRFMSNAAENMDMLSHFLEYSENDEFKPYLRPMSSMTEEEKKEFLELSDCMIDDWMIKPETCCYFMNKLTDWLNEHHFDYRGLIEMGLALEAPEGMYNKLN